ncbi:MAG TPA: CRISPR-associated endonuclease Cas3'', partial [Thermopetrobacter sp.]|nr:CRISPR-associated endonuclease Cas3'' [Thermopetrobacter sp.]
MRDERPGPKPTAPATAPQRRGEPAGPDSPRPRQTFYAHTLPGRPPEEWQPLEEHLHNVAELAAQFAEPFGAREWARIAGLWHDLGKYSEAFQAYLRDAAGEDYHEAELHGRVDHTSAGAQHAVAAIRVLGHLLAYPIAGHHAGLLDAIADGACLERRLTKPVAPWGRAPAAAASSPDLALPPFLEEALGRRATDPAAAAFSFSF